MADLSASCWFMLRQLCEAGPLIRNEATETGDALIAAGYAEVRDSDEEEYPSLVATYAGIDAHKARSATGKA